MASPRAIRVISGKWGNQTIYAPMNFRSRPMGERQRQAIFNSLIDDLPGAIVLDAYAGSGAIGIEAISRGAKQSYFVEKNYSVYKQIRNNLQNLKVPEKQYQLFRCSAHAFTKTMKNLKFNVIIADPPYTEFKIEQIEELAVMLAEGGILIISSPASEEMPPTILSLNLTRQKKMAAAQLSFYS